MHAFGSKKCKGLLLLVFGILFLLNTTGVWPEFTFEKYWPLILIALGLHSLLCGRCFGKMSGECSGCGCEGGECKCEMPMHKKMK